MAETMRLLLESPVRERIRREHRCPPMLDDPRLAEAQADLIEGIIREVLDGLDLPPEQHEKGLALAAAGLRRAAREDEHDDPIGSGDGGYQRAVSYQR